MPNQTKCFGPENVVLKHGASTVQRGTTNPFSSEATISEATIIDRSHFEWFASSRDR